MMNIILIPLLLYAPLLWAETLHVKNVRTWAAPDSTRVVFDISRPAKQKMILLADPYRVVLDIEDARFDASATTLNANDKYLSGIRTASRNKADLRIVLDLKKFAQVKVFQLPPNKRYGQRLVVDLFGQQTQEKTTAVTPFVEHISVTPRDILVAIDAGHGG